MYRVVAGILTILISNTVFALDNEYKNTLTGVELAKSSDSSYNINIYTSKEYSQPVKVIKKSDLNYYILLPETNSTAQNSSISNSDIRNVETVLFPYAGAEIKNGYTKININTTKPIKFKVNTKTKVASTSQNTVKEPQKTLQKEPQKEQNKAIAETAKVQKKNSIQETQKQQVNNTTSSTKKDADLKNDLLKKSTKPTVMAAAKVTVPAKDVKKQDKNVTKKSTSTLKTQKVTPPQETKKEVKKEVKKEIKKELKQEVKKEVQNVKPKEDIKKTVEELKEPIHKEESIQKENNQNISEEKSEPYLDTNAEFEEKMLQDITKPEEKQENTIAQQEPEDNATFKNKLGEYGINIREFILMIIAGMLSFIVMMLMLNKNKDSDTRLKSKTEFLEKKSKPTSSLVPKKTVQPPKNNNQYFIFDKNVKQTGLIAPASSEKLNCELSKYEPIEKNQNINAAEQNKSSNKSEYEIIQNILKEDSFIEYSSNDTLLNKKQPPIVKPQEKKVAPIVKKKEAEQPSPEILSSVEIAPQRGFMCVSYNNSINLIGYIFDDIFALYNFRQPKLENYNIKFRLSEKTAHGANFIVRVDKLKMLVNVTKSSMNLEIAM